MAVALTAVETRYLPVLDPEWLQLINADQDEWQRYRDGFDPVAASTQLGYLADRARQDAEAVLRAQGVRAANPAEVEELVRICTCYCPAMQPGR